MLYITSTMIVVDAVSCKKTAKTIIAKKTDYIFNVKNNHANLKEDYRRLYSST